MSRQLSRRRLLAGTGTALAAGAVPAVAGARSDEQSSTTTDPPAVRWDKLYDTRANQRVSAVVENDGTYAALGRTSDEEGENRTGWLFAVDGKSGDGLWSRDIELEETDSEYTFSGLVPAGDEIGRAHV